MTLLGSKGLGTAQAAFNVGASRGWQGKGSLPKFTGMQRIPSPTGDELGQLKSHA